MVREKRSYQIATLYRTKKSTVLYHDFAEDVLPLFIEKTKKHLSSSSVLLNVNPYIRSKATKEKLVSYALDHEKATYFPAEIGVDDGFFYELKEQIP